MNGGRVADCGHPYYRIQKTHVWTALSGHRDGNVLIEKRICTKCQTPDLAQALIRSMGMYVAPDAPKKFTNGLYAIGGGKKRKKNEAA